MQVSINVDETMFKDVIEKELYSFPKERISELIESCIKEYLCSNDYKAIERLFFTKGNVYSEYTLTSLAKDIITKADTTKKTQEIVDFCMDIIKNKKEELLYTCISDFLLSAIVHNDIFNNAIYHSLAAMKCELREEITKSIRGY